jgi:hypothetical protein
VLTAPSVKPDFEATLQRDPASLDELGMRTVFGGIEKMVLDGVKKYLIPADPPDRSSRLGPEGSIAERSNGVGCRGTHAGIPAVFHRARDGLAEHGRRRLD